MFELIRANQRRAALLVVAMAGLLLATGWAVGELLQAGGGAAGLGGGFILWLVLAVVAYSSGDSIFLALAGGRAISKADNPVLFNVVEEMCVASGLAKQPAIYVIDQDAPNAFATGKGPERASIAVTAGLLERLDRDQLQGVVAHEIAHIRNRDVLYLTMLVAMAGAIVILSDTGRRVLWFGGGRRRTSSRGGGAGGALAIVALVLVILAPLLAQLLYLAVSRRREYLADACSAQFTRYPEGLAGALETIAAAPVALTGASRAMSPMYIHDPMLRPGVAAMGALGSTHPPVAERIRILRSMGGGAALASYDEAFRKVTGRPVGVVPATALAGERLKPALRSIGAGRLAGAAGTSAAAAAAARGGAAMGVAGSISGAALSGGVGLAGGGAGDAVAGAPAQENPAVSAPAPGSAAAGTPSVSTPAMARAAALSTVPARLPEPDPRTHLDRVRETTDMFWRLRGFAFLPCACGTTLKVPPEYAGRTLSCPHCAARHEVPVQRAS